jgi:YesN/AraC family two-component response regulator
MNTVLVIDDELFILKIIEYCLFLLDYHPILFNSGDSALKIFSKIHFDLVIVDFVMPQMNGFEVAEKMKLIRPEQKIVIMSDIDDFGSSRNTTKIDHFLIKPFTIKELESVLQNVFNNNKIIKVDYKNA